MRGLIAVGAVMVAAIYAFDLVALLEATAEVDFQSLATGEATALAIIGALLVSLFVEHGKALSSRPLVLLPDQDDNQLHQGWIRAGKTKPGLAPVEREATSRRERGEEEFGEAVNIVGDHLVVVNPEGRVYFYERYQGGSEAWGEFDPGVES